MLRSPPTSPQDTAVGIGRYNGPAQLLHWITLLVIFSILPLGWVMVHMAKDAPGRNSYFFVHKSLGVLALILIIARLIWRAIRNPPPLPAVIAKWENRLADATHFFLYAIFIIMPVSGYIASSASGHPPSLFGLPLPQLPKNEGAAKLADRIHMYGQYAVYLFLTLHIIGVIWHVAYRKDGYLQRMLPEQVGSLQHAAAERISEN